MHADPFRWCLLARLAPLLIAAAALVGCDKRQATESAQGPIAASSPAASAPTLGAASSVAGASAPAATASADFTAGGPPDFTRLFEKVGPTVVNVTTSSTVAVAAAGPADPDDPLSQFFRRFSPQPPQGGESMRQRGVGSGFIVDTAGHILTNAHVVANADQVLVRLADSKREFKARVVGSDRQTDVALLKVEAKDLPAAPLGDSAHLKAGEWVAAIGSPFGFANTITAGIVSATERALPDETYVPFIQTDVAVNPGNSGGPLINLRGEVVGINSQIYSRTGGYMGVSFAIPINMAMEVANQLRTEGRVRRGRLGIGIQEMSEELAQSFKLNEPRGAIVTTVEPNSPAAKAGLQTGDVILRFDGKDIRSASDLPRLVASTKPGSQAALEIWRDGASRTVNATVSEAPTASEAGAREASPPTRQAQRGASRLGIAVSELPPQGRRALGIDYGLVVEGVQGENADAPLQRGDVIIAINNERFKSFDDFTRRVAQAPPGSRVALLVRRGDANLYVPVTVGKETG
jgi:serine protease Do